MLKLFHKLQTQRRALSRKFGNSISTPAARLGSHIHFQLIDFQILRHLWTNFDQVAEGVYRSNQPDWRRLRNAKKMGIKSVLNLRGETDRAHYLFEAEYCETLGLNLHSISLGARHAPEREKLLDVIKLLPQLEKPFVLHCKSGADRAGLVSVIYLITQTKTSLSDARVHLSFRYLHLKSTDTGILDHVLDLYAPLEAEIGFEDWVRDVYDPETATQSFAALRQKNRTLIGHKE